MDASSLSVFERFFLDFKKRLVFMFQTCIVASIKQKIIFEVLEDVLWILNLIVL